MTAKGGNFGAPCDQAIAVTPSDTVDLAVPSRYLYVGGEGSLTVIMAGPDGNTVLFPVLNSADVLPIIVSRVKSTGTTATSIVSLF